MCIRDRTLIVSADSILMAAGQKVDLSFLGDKYGLALEDVYKRQYEDDIPDKAWGTGTHRTCKQMSWTHRCCT